MLVTKIPQTSSVDKKHYKQQAKTISQLTCRLFNEEDTENFLHELTQKRQKQASKTSGEGTNILQPKSGENLQQPQH